MTVSAPTSPSSATVWSRTSWAASAGALQQLHLLLGADHPGGEARAGHEGGVLLGGDGEDDGPLGRREDREGLAQGGEGEV